MSLSIYTNLELIWVTFIKLNYDLNSFFLLKSNTNTLQFLVIFFRSIKSCSISQAYCLTIVKIVHEGLYLLKIIWIESQQQYLSDNLRTYQANCYKTDIYMLDLSQSLLIGSFRLGREQNMNDRITDLKMTRSYHLQTLLLSPGRSSVWFIWIFHYIVTRLSSWNWNWDPMFVPRVSNL